MGSEIDDLVLECIKVNFKSCYRIAQELGIHRNRIRNSIIRLKKRDYLTWILFSASELRGANPIKYLWLEKN